MNDAELHEFYFGMVARLRERGVVCAITSGLACVHFGVAETTKITPFTSNRIGNGT